MRALLFAAAFVIICCSCAVASLLEPADTPYSAQVVGTQTAPGSNTWAYTVTNTSSSSKYVAWLLSIEVDPISLVLPEEAAEIVTYSGVTGWAPSFDPAVGKNTINWFTFTRELPAGESQIGFQLTFNRVPQFQNWTVMFDNVENAGEAPVAFGDIQSVPEPTGIAALALGLTALAGVLRRRQS